MSSDSLYSVYHLKSTHGCLPLRTKEELKFCYFSFLSEELCHFLVILSQLRLPNECGKESHQTGMHLLQLIMLSPAPFFNK